MKTSCPQCGTAYPILAEHVGRKVKCSREGCGFSFLADQSPEVVADTEDVQPGDTPLLKRRNWKVAYTESQPREIKQDNRDRDERRRKIPVVSTEDFVRGDIGIRHHIGFLCTRKIRRTSMTFETLDAIFSLFGAGLDTSATNLYHAMEADLLDDLRSQADKIGAGAIVGLQLRFDEVLFWNVVFLTGYAQGTAVRLSGEVLCE